MKLPRTVDFRPIARCGIAIALMGACCGCYVLKQGAYLVNHQVHARPIERLGADSSITEDQRKFLTEINRIRAFAADSMGLVRNRNYTRLVEIDSSYLLAMLSAADSASFTVKKWCYPFLGCFPLRSYFDLRDARRTGARLAREGYEISIEKVDGYSTLGIFSDPVYSFMADYPVFTLASYIFHEQTHATAYFKNVQFSEELATFMGREGALRYLRAYYGPDSKEYNDAVQLISDSNVWLGLLRGLIAELDSIYRQPIGRAEKISRKTVAIGRFKTMLAVSYDSIFVGQAYRGAEKQSYNNAYLAVRSTYTRDLELFTKLYVKYGRDLRRVTAFAVACRKRNGDPKQQLIDEINR